MAEEHKLLKPEDLAKQLDLGKDQVVALARSGLLPAVRVGRLWRFHPAKIAEWIDNGGAGGWKRTPTTEMREQVCA